MWASFLEEESQIINVGFDCAQREVCLWILALIGGGEGNEFIWGHGHAALAHEGELTVPGSAHASFWREAEDMNGCLPQFIALPPFLLALWNNREETPLRRVRRRSTYLFFRSLFFRTFIKRARAVCGSGGKASVFSCDGCV